LASGAIVRGMTRPREADADSRLESALEEYGFIDPRPAFRERLRQLREANPAAFDAAKRAHDAVMRAASDDPVTAWIEYGRQLGEQTAPGRMLAIDASGKAEPYRAPAHAGLMVLHVPDDTGTPVLVTALPRAPTPAQTATYDLLVLKKLGL
jgi:hypothetical protein